MDGGQGGYGEGGRMNTEEKRIKIAGAVGNNDQHWECPSCGRVESTHVSYEERHSVDGCLQFVHWVESPDYFNDLNAMHEVEKILRSDKWKWLSYVNSLNEMPSLQDEWLCASLHATAAERAEAFGRTLNLWTNDHPPKFHPRPSPETIRSDEPASRRRRDF